MRETKELLVVEKENGIFNKIKNLFLKITGKYNKTDVNVNIKMYNFWNIIMYNFVHYYIRFPSQTLVEFYLLIDMNFH